MLLLPLPPLPQNPQVTYVACGQSFLVALAIARPAESRSLDLAAAKTQAEVAAARAAALAATAALDDLGGAGGAGSGGDGGGGGARGDGPQAHRKQPPRARPNGGGGGGGGGWGGAGAVTKPTPPNIRAFKQNQYARQAAAADLEYGDGAQQVRQDRVAASSPLCRAVKA